jgi:hypothetical protein
MDKPMLITEQIVSEYRDEKMSDVFSGIRKPEVVKTRHLIWYFLYTENDLIFEQIAERYKMSPEAVRTGINRYKSAYKADSDYRHIADILKNKVREALI